MRRSGVGLWKGPQESPFQIVKESYLVIFLIHWIIPFPSSLYFGDKFSFSFTCRRYSPKMSSRWCSLPFSLENPDFQNGLKNKKKKQSWPLCRWTSSFTHFFPVLFCFFLEKVKRFRWNLRQPGINSPSLAATQLLSSGSVTLAKIPCP